MGIKYRVVNFELNRIRLAQEIIYAMSIKKLTQEEIAAAAGLSASAVMEIREARNKNPEMRTLLGVINALDLDPRDYFQLED